MTDTSMIAGIPDADLVRTIRLITGKPTITPTEAAEALHRLQLSIMVLESWLDGIGAGDALWSLHRRIGEAAGDPTVTRALVEATP